MKVKTGNPDFAYEISCDQMCGKGHFTMRGVIVVESQQEFDGWMATQKPEYYRHFLNWILIRPAVPTDSTKTVAQA